MPNGQHDPKRSFALGVRTARRFRNLESIVRSITTDVRPEVVEIMQLHIFRSLGRQAFVTIPFLSTAARSSVKSVLPVALWHQIGVCSATERDRS
jgi:hypothetical protein